MKYKIHRAKKCFYIPGEITHIFDTENKIVIKKDDPEFMQWVADGNNPTDEDTEWKLKEEKRKKAILLKDKVKDKNALSKDELATILESLMDLLG